MMRPGAEILPFPAQAPRRHSPAAYVLAGLLILTRVGVCGLAALGFARLFGY